MLSCEDYELQKLVKRLDDRAHKLLTRAPDRRFSTTYEKRGDETFVEHASEKAAEYADVIEHRVHADARNPLYRAGFEYGRAQGLTDAAHEINRLRRMLRGEGGPA